MSDWPLTGRDEELAAIDRATSCKTGARGVVLAGAPGVGKTRLAREALARADGNGRPTSWVAATASSRHLPLGALALLVGDVGGDPRWMLQRAADALLAVAADNQPVLVVDDAHLLDDLSASLVQQLVVQRKASVVVTVRSGEPAPHAVESLWKDGYLDRIEVQALSFDETAALVTAVLGGTLERTSAHRMYDLSDGNVLFLRHIVAGELAAGHLGEHAGEWRWRGGVTVSAELAELVGRRLVGLPGEITELLDMLALAGPLDEKAVVQLAPRSIVEKAEALGLVRVGIEADQAVVRLDHPLYGEVRLAQLGTLRARRLRGAIATALSELPADSTATTLRQALLQLDSDLPPDVELLTAAAQAALRLFDWRLAQRLANAAIQAGGGFEASLALSYALGFGLDPLAADRTLERLVDTAGDDLQLVRASAPRAGHLYYMQGRISEAMQVLEQARLAIHDAAMRPLVDGMRAMFAAMSADADTALRLAAEVLAAGPLPPQVELCARWARVTSLGAIGRTDEIGEPEDRQHRTASASYDSSLPRIGYGEQHVRALCVAGRVRQAGDLARTLRPDVRDTADVYSLMAESVVGRADLAHGRVGAARKVAARCLDGLRGRDTSGWLYVTAMTLANACAMAGDGPAARAAAEEMERERHPGFTVLETERLLTWAWVEAAEGSTTGAVDHAHKAATHAADHGQWGFEAFALAAAVRFGDLTAADRLVGLERCVQGPLVTAAATQAVALAASDAEGLLEASKSFENMGDLSGAADAAAQAAQCYLIEGARAAHMQACSRARRLQSECDGIMTPALAATLHPLPITDREREIVALAATGLSNRDIAERLVISLRTVEGHLYRAGAKLGTSDRSQFAALLRGD
ncbi:MAG TPA: LuxR C-terminal-related transcriptional regulator [Kribbella sp.]